MRILIVADTYPPSRISGAVQMRDLALELRKQGHAPAVVTPCADLGRVWGLEDDDGVRVLRVKAMRTKNVRYARRALAELLLPVALYWGFRISPLYRESWDGVVWYSPTIFLGPFVRQLKRHFRAKGYLILRDLFPDWAVDAGVMRRGVAYALLKRIERYQYGVADTIGVQSQGNIRAVARTVRRGAPTIEVLENWKNPQVCEENDKRLSTTTLAGKAVFVYAGNMGVAHAVGQAMDLAAGLRDRGDVGFLFVGRGSDVDRLRRRALRENLTHVLFMDEIASEEIPGLLGQCHVGILTLHPGHKTHNIPGKFLTYLWAGLPVLAFVNAGNDLENLIREEGVGYASTDGAVGELCRAANELLDNPALHSAMARRCRDLARRNYAPASAARKVIAALR